MNQKTFKKISSIFLVFALIVGIFPLSTLTSFATGESIKNPVICNSFSEFKAAMENEEIIYVSLGNADELLPTVEGDGTIAAITVKGTKRLKLNGNATYFASKEGKIYDCLLLVEENNELYVQGSGRISFRSVGTSTSNAVIRNSGGRVIINDVYFHGSFHAGTYGMAVWQDYGDLFIYKGVFRSENGKDISNEGKVTYPVYVMDGSATIYGGDFYSSNYASAEGIPYGICISQDATVYLSGGTYQGIRIPYGKTLKDYIPDDFVMTYSGEKVDPSEFGSVSGNIEIEIYKEISSVDVNINAPSDGEYVSYSVYNVPYGAYFHTAHWYENGKYIGSDSKFAAGKSYRVEIYLIAHENAKFSKSLKSTTINYANAEIIDDDNDRETVIGLAIEFGVCPENIDSIELTVDSPKEHYTPAKYVSCGSSAYKQALVGDNMFDTPLQWQESTDGKNWSVMKETDKFSVGKYYRVFIDVISNAGYKFKLDTKFEPRVTAKVNGYSAVVSRYPEENPEELISVCYNFGVLNDNVIEEIRISEVTAPVVGEKPSYNCAISGIGYSINTAYSNNTYVINGICWRDTTDDKWVYPSDTFQIGHKYKVFIDVKTNSGYEFYTSGSSYKPQGWGYIDNNYATLGVQSDARFEQSLSWEYTCQPKTVNSIEVNGLNVPADGTTPDFDAITNSDYYFVNSIVWYDYENEMNEMTEDDMFIGGNRYHAMIEIKPKEENGNNLCKFVSGKTTASLNGIEVKKLANDSWQEVTSTTKSVTIWYTFNKATSENDFFISGKVKTFNDENGEITLSLYKENSLTPEQKIVIKGNTTDYHFASVDTGTYTLKVSKENHVTTEYSITVNSSVILDVETWIYGDVTGDGVVNGTDYLRVKGHFIGTYKLSGLGKLSGDVTGDGVINGTDYLRIKGHFIGNYNLYK